MIDFVIAAHGRVDYGFYCSHEWRVIHPKMSSHINIGTFPESVSLLVVVVVVDVVLHICNYSVALDTFDIGVDKIYSYLWVFARDVFKVSTIKTKSHHFVSGIELDKVTFILELFTYCFSPLFNEVHIPGLTISENRGQSSRYSQINIHSETMRSVLVSEYRYFQSVYSLSCTNPTNGP